MAIRKAVRLIRTNTSTNTPVATANAEPWSWQQKTASDAPQAAIPDPVATTPPADVKTPPAASQSDFVSIPISQLPPELQPKKKSFPWYMLAAAAVVVFVAVGFKTYTNFQSQQGRLYSLLNKYQKELASKDEKISLFGFGERKPEEPKATEEQPIVGPAKATDATHLSKIAESRYNYVRASRGDGKVVLRTGGSPSWRYHNPALLAWGDFARQLGAVGPAYSKYAIFPSYTVGRAAGLTYFFGAEPMRSKSISEAMNSFYGRKKKASAVARQIAKKLNVGPNTILNHLSEERRQKFMDLIQKNEDWLDGIERIYEDQTDWKKRGY